MQVHNENFIEDCDGVGDKFLKIMRTPFLWQYILSFKRPIKIRFSAWHAIKYNQLLFFKFTPFQKMIFNGYEASLLCSLDNVQLLKYLFERDYPLGSYENCIAIAATHNNLNILKFLNEKMNITTCTHVAMDEAASLGHIECLKYLNEHVESATCSTLGKKRKIYFYSFFFLKKKTLLLLLFSLLIYSNGFRSEKRTFALFKVFKFKSKKSALFVTCNGECN